MIPGQGIEGPGGVGAHIAQGRGLGKGVGGEAVENTVAIAHTIEGALTVDGQIVHILSQLSQHRHNAGEHIDGTQVGNPLPVGVGVVETVEFAILFVVGQVPEVLDGRLLCVQGGNGRKVTHVLILCHHEAVFAVHREDIASRESSGFDVVVRHIAQPCFATRLVEAHPVVVGVAILGRAVESGEIRSRFAARQIQRHLIGGSVAGVVINGNQELLAGHAVQGKFNRYILARLRLVRHYAGQNADAGAVQQSHGRHILIVRGSNPEAVTFNLACIHIFHHRIGAINGELG